MKQRPVIIIHGARQNEKAARGWMDEFGEFLLDNVPGVFPLPYFYGWVPVSGIELPIVGELVRAHHVARFQQWQAEILSSQSDTFEKTPSVVGYSFGTHVGHFAMTGRRGPRAFYHQVFYMGGIVSARETFENEFGHFDRIFNFYSKEDNAVRLDRFGHCGLRGFCYEPPALNYRARWCDGREYEHGDYTTRGPVWETIATHLRAA